MRAVIQRVRKAQVDVEGKTVGSIGVGLLILLGVGQNDTQLDAEQLWNKIIKLRIFEDEEGKTNLSLRDINGEVLVVSQFTLYANCKKGNRPSFVEAGNPKQAQELYEYFVSQARCDISHVDTGIFAAMMDVSLINDGPFTIVLDTEAW